MVSRSWCIKKTRVIMQFARYSGFMSKAEIGPYTQSQKKASKMTFLKSSEPWMTPSTSTKRTTSVQKFKNYRNERPLLYRDGPNSIRACPQLIPLTTSLKTRGTTPHTWAFNSLIGDRRGDKRNKTQKAFIKIIIKQPQLKFSVLILFVPTA